MVEEVRTDRELAYRPYLSFNQWQVHAAGGYDHYKENVVNVGRGPAINCLLARFIIHEMWCLSATFELGSNGAKWDSRPPRTALHHPFSLKLVPVAR